MTRALTRFFSDRRGAVAVWAALLAPVLIGGVALAVDVGRLYNLDADLQSAADAMARAGAAELDGSADAILRATAAVDNLVRNDQRFADKSGAVGVQRVIFLSGLPADDSQAVGADAETTDPAEARYIQIAVKPERVTTMFPAQALSALARINLQAESTGGRTARVCNAAPLFICDPYEDTGTSLAEALNDRTIRGRLVQLRGKGGSAKYGPGNFGFLQPPGGGGAKALSEMFAQAHPAACFDQRGVELRPGQISSVSQGLNVRFDMYDGSFSKMKNDPEYAPAANVTKGYTGGACNASPNGQAMGLPRDACFATGTCPHMGGRMGDGDWDFVQYMQVNHGSPSSVTIGEVTYSLNYAAKSVSPSSKPTRFEVYRWEIDSGRIPGQSGYGASKTPEVGVPRCFSGGVAADQPDRRLLTVAVLQCRKLDAEYGMNGNSTPPLPASGFVKVFLTEPMGSGPDDSIWGEIVGMLENGVDAQARNQIEVRR